MLGWVKPKPRASRRNLRDNPGGVGKEFISPRVSQAWWLRKVTTPIPPSPSCSISCSERLFADHVLGAQQSRRKILKNKRVPENRNFLGAGDSVKAFALKGSIFQENFRLRRSGKLVARFSVPAADEILPAWYKLRPALARIAMARERLIAPGFRSPAAHRNSSGLWTVEA